MQPLIDYLLALDALKSVNRRNYTTQLSKDTPRRLENSAEHSWHLAMACWAVAQHFKLDVNHEKLLKLALVHDLGEIEAGDTFSYTFTEAGEFPYHCEPHPWMIGTVIVE